MPNFDNKSMKKYLKSTTFKSNIYLNSISIHNYTICDNFSNTTYKVYVPSIGNKMKYYAIKYGGGYLKNYHNMSTK